METEEFKSIIEKVVSECFPDETLVFAECSDSLIADIFAGNYKRYARGNADNNAHENAGEFGMVSVKEVIEAGKSAMEFFTATVGLYKVWKEIRDQAKGEDEGEALRHRLKIALLDAGVSPAKVDKVAGVVFRELQGVRIENKNPTL